MERNLFLMLSISEVLMDMGLDRSYLEGWDGDIGRLQML